MDSYDLPQYFLLFDFFSKIKQIKDQKIKIKYKLNSQRETFTLSFQTEYDFHSFKHTIDPYI